MSAAGGGLPLCRPPLYLCAGGCRPQLDSGRPDHTLQSGTVTRRPLLVGWSAGNNSRYIQGLLALPEALQADVLGDTHRGWLSGRGGWPTLSLRQRHNALWPAASGLSPGPDAVPTLANGNDGTPT